MPHVSKILKSADTPTKTAISFIGCLVLIGLAGLSHAAAISEAPPQNSINAITKGTLIIHIKGLKPEQGGNLIVTLYQGEDSWLKSEKAYSVKSQAIGSENSTRITFHDVPFSESNAVQVVHDANQNGKMDFKWFPPGPEEGAAFSNNYVPMAKPNYKKAEFSFSKSSLELDIDLLY